MLNEFRAGKVYIACGYTDLRRGIDGLAGMVQQQFQLDPLYRQEQKLNRSGIRLSRQTMPNWLLRAADDWLTPVYEEMKKRLVKEEVLHADETTLVLYNRK